MNTHSINIPLFLRVYDNALSDLGSILSNAGYQKVIVYFGNDLIDLFGSTVLTSLHDSGVEVLAYKELDTIDMQDIIEIAFSLPSKTQAVLGIGGGKVIDAAKYISYLKKLPFISIPTSTSSDGFASSSASLLLNGKRNSVPAKMAAGIVVDTQVIRTAPERFIYSGIGDMISKITSLYDWLYEEQCGNTKIDDFAMMIAKKAVNSFVRTPYESIKEQVFLKELVDSLAMSGIANEIAGSSAPVSGSEHLISHALDKILDVPQLHGVQVGIATYLMSKVQDHRYVRVDTVLEQTGFYDYVKTLKMRKADFLQAIDMAPDIKPNRHTYLHEEKYRTLAQQLVQEDARLNEILV